MCSPRSATTPSTRMRSTTRNRATSCGRTCRRSSTFRHCPCALTTATTRPSTRSLTGSSTRHGEIPHRVPLRTHSLRGLRQFSFTKTRAGEPRSIPLVLRHAPPAAPGLAALVTLLVLASGFLPNAFILATGAVVSAVARGAGDGIDSPAGHDLVTALIAVAVLFIAQQTIGPMRDAAAQIWGLRFRARISERVMRAVVTPPGIAHLEDPTTLDDIARAQGVGPGGIGPSDALNGVIMLAELRFAAVVSAVILASFRWWLAIALLVFRLWIRKTVWKQMAQGSAVALERTQQARFATYLRDLTLRGESAKETRLFGLGPWIVGRFVTSWQETLDGVWRERRKGDARVLRGALYVFVADALAFGVIARAASTGE